MGNLVEGLREIGKYFIDLSALSSDIANVLFMKKDLIQLQVNDCLGCKKIDVSI